MIAEVLAVLALDRVVRRVPGNVYDLVGIPIHAGLARQLVLPFEAIVILDPPQNSVSRWHIGITANLAQCLAFRHALANRRDDLLRKFRWPSRLFWLLNFGF